MEQGAVALGVAGLVLAGISVAGVLHVRALNAPPPLPPIAAVPAESPKVAPAPTFGDQPGAPRDVPPVEHLGGAPQAAVQQTAAQQTGVAAPFIDPVALKTARRSVNVVMYTTTWCPQCKRAKAWMRENDVYFTEHDIEASESAMRACRKLNPSASIPTIDIDGEAFVGFSAEGLRYAMDKAASRRLHAP